MPKKLLMVSNPETLKKSKISCINPYFTESELKT